MVHTELDLRERRTIELGCSFLSVSINILKVLSEGCQQEIWGARNGPQGQGKFTVEAQSSEAISPKQQLCFIF